MIRFTPMAELEPNLRQKVNSLADEILRENYSPTTTRLEAVAEAQAELGIEPTTVRYPTYNQKGDKIWVSVPA